MIEKKTNFLELLKASLGLWQIPERSPSNYPVVDSQESSLEDSFENPRENS